MARALNARHPGFNSQSCHGMNIFVAFLNSTPSMDMDVNLLG